MLSRFPKTRQSLPPEIEKIYVAHNKQNRAGETPATFLSQRMELWLHRQVAADVRFDRSCKTTLEIGAGTLNQLQHEPDVGPYDIVEPFGELYKGSGLLSRIRNMYTDIREISQHEQYDRITSIATFEHVCNLPELIARSGLLLKRGKAHSGWPFQAKGHFCGLWAGNSPRDLSFESSMGLTTAC